MGAAGHVAQVVHAVLLRLRSGASVSIPNPQRACAVASQARQPLHSNEAQEQRRTGHITILKKGEGVRALVDGAMVITLVNGLRRGGSKIERKKKCPTKSSDPTRRRSRSARRKASNTNRKTNTPAKTGKRIAGKDGDKS
jgi:hypothetical protein